MQYLFVPLGHRFDRQQSDNEEDEVGSDVPHEEDRDPVGGQRLDPGIRHLWTKIKKKILNKKSFNVVLNVNWLKEQMFSCAQSFKQFMLIIYESRDVIGGIFKSGTSLESKITIVEAL